MPRKGSFGEISAISAWLDKGRQGGESPGYLIVKTFRQIRKELDAQGKTTAQISSNGVLQIFEVGNEIPEWVDLAASDAGTANRAARVDHHHHLDEDIAPTWTSPHRWVTPTAEIVDATGALNLTCTLPNTNMSGTGSPGGMRLAVTSPSGSGTPTNQSHAIAAFQATLLPGYTGTAGNFVISGLNTTAGTGTSEYNNPASPGVGMNRGSFSSATAVTIGFNCGAHFQGHNGARNYGVIGDSQQPNSAVSNVGVAGWARNTAQSDGQFGVWAGLFGPASAGAAITIPSPRTRYGVGSALVADNASETSALIALFYRGGGASPGIAWQWGAEGGATVFGSVIGAGNTPLRIFANASQTADLFLVGNSGGTNLFSIRSGGIVDLEAVGNVVSNVADGASNIAFHYNDELTARSTGYIERLQRSGASRIIRNVTWDGRYFFGYSASGTPGTGTILAFTQQDSESVAGAPHFIGVNGIVIHDDSAETVTSHAGLIGQSEIAHQTTTSFDITQGMLGRACSRGANVTTGMSGKVMVGVRGRIDGIALPGAPQAKDTLTAGNQVPKGNWDSAGCLWADFTAHSGTGLYPSTSQLPLVGFGVRVPIQGFPASTSSGTPFGKQIGIWGQDPNTGHASNYPATVGFMDVPYPRRTGGTGTRAYHLWLEPWANTSTIRGNGDKGDLYFDDGTNFSAGLWECFADGFWRRVSFDETAAHDFTATQTFSATPGIKTDSIDDNGSGQVQFQDDIELGGFNLFASSPGSDIFGSGGLGSFFGGTPITRPSGSAQGAVTNSVGTADGTIQDVDNGAGLADATKTNDNFRDVTTLLNALRTALVNLNLIQGS